MANPLIALLTFGIIVAVELPDTSGLAALVLGTRYRPSWVFAGVAAAFTAHVAMAVTAGSLLAVLPRRPVQVVAAVVFLVAAVLLFRQDDDDDEEDRLTSSGAGFLKVAAMSFGIIALAELGDPSEIMIANLAARYHSPVAVGVGSVLALWVVAALAVTGGRGLMRVLPLPWITRLAAAAMVVMAGFSVAAALR